MQSGAEWLAAFEAAHGRKLRILHIGNIANNAYHNAKLLNAAGADCHVLCPEFYHIMGCPEWEDADFDAPINNHHYPDWSELALGGFERPRWFVQGPLDLCVAYLLAINRTITKRSDHCWKQLGLMNRTIPARGFGKLAVSIIRIRLFGLRVLRFLLLPQRVSDKISEIYLRLQRQIPARRLAITLILRLTRPLLMLLSHTISWYGRHFLFKNVIDGHENSVSGRLLDDFNRAFPEREDRLKLTDLLPHLFQRQQLQELLAYYDVVQAYATEVTIPMVSGSRFVAFEHGTLREIPFKATPQGRLTALGFNKAEHIFVTNVDCLDNARRLATGGVTFINHPYDEDHSKNVHGVAQLRAKLQSELRSEFLIFAPTRHDWVPKTGFADKANDVFLRAFATMRNAGLRVGTILCNWGANVSESTRLIDELGCGEFVKWRPPLGMINFDRHAMACDIVVDQFLLGAFGGITFKAMSAGAPVCSYLDSDEVLKRFERAPPLVNCRTEEDIVTQLSDLYRNTERVVELGKCSRDWIENYHRAELVVNEQCAVYADNMRM